MLTHIHIWNFAIVEALDIELEHGLSVLTGETGAGKSILLDALGLALGDRADNTVIRHGQTRAEISVTFDTSNATNAEAWLKEHELDSEHECIIRRTVSEKGPSQAFINGKPATVQQLRELAEMLNSSPRSRLSRCLTIVVLPDPDGALNMKSFPLIQSTICLFLLRPLRVMSWVHWPILSIVWLSV